MASTQRKITDGPGKFDVMMAIMEGREVEFTIEGFGKQKVEILGGRVTDRKTESWTIEFKLVDSGSQAVHVGSYSSTERQGFTDLPDDAIPRIPRDGDPAYTDFHGRRWIGVLAGMRDNNVTQPEFGPRWFGTVVPADATEAWGFHGKNCRGIYAGYDGPFVWDAEAGMWNAHADHD